MCDGYTYVLMYGMEGQTGEKSETAVYRASLEFQFQGCFLSMKIAKVGLFVPNFKVFHISFQKATDVKFKRSQLVENTIQNK